MKRLAGFVILMQTLLMAGAGAVVYVDKSAPGGDGSSWAAAFNTLQPAIDAAFANGQEVWVAVGDYDEARDLPDANYPELHWGSLVIRPGVQLYGGFAGDETHRDQRDWENNITIINSAVGGAIVCHVIKMSDGVLDGFTVTGGYLDQRFMACYDGAGAGLVVSGGAPSVRNCIFVDNYAGAAGAVAASGCAGTFENCTFTKNSSNLGGAVVLSGSSTTFSKCRFESNTCWGYRGYSTYGGAIYMGSSSPLFINCVFGNNTVYSGYSNPSYGGAISAGGSSPEFLNCTFYGNTATDDWPDISTNYGGAVYCDESSLASLTNCILWGNVPDQVYGPAVVVSSDIQGGLAGSMDTDPLFSSAGGRLSADSPCIGAGLLEGAPADDIRGVARPQGAGVDLGAYEMVYATASFSADKNSGLLPLDVRFTDLTSNPGVTEWLWDFGDGATSTEQNPAHTYATAGSFSVSLTVTTIDCTDTKVVAECVTVYGELTPAFSMDTNFGQRSLQVQFTDQSVSPTPITAWLWKFGDGSISTQQNPLHIYRVPGLFSVSLTVTAGPDSAKCTRQNAILVTNRSGVTPRPWIIRWIESQLE